MARSLRPSGADDLGLRRALSDRLLPLLVAAMTFLAALALAGSMAAAGLAEHWRSGAASMLTVQVPSPDVGTAAGGSRADNVARILGGTVGIESSHRLSSDEIAALLKPWLGENPASLALPLPAMFEVRLNGAAFDAAGLAAKLAQAAPGTLVERNGAWLARLADLVRSLRACAALSLLFVAFIAAAVISLATRAGLAWRRDAIEIVHGLGATDGMIAGLFAMRMTILTLGGALLGLVVSTPVLLGLTSLAAPFGSGSAEPLTPAELLRALPPVLWTQLASLPPIAAGIGWVTAQATVRRWLGKLP
jgi:cell division transport system permease protein